MSSAQPLGYRYCLKQLGLTPWPLHCESRLGPRRDTGREGDSIIQVYPQLLAAPGGQENAIPTHLEFALRHEGVDLAAMAAVCAAMDPRLLAAWISARPSSKYARKLGFLYEWLTGRELPVDVTLIAGSYEPVLDPAQCFTGPVTNVPRWHVRNNLPGTPEWCPTVHRESVQGSPVGTLDVAAELAEARAHLSRESYAQALAAAGLAEVQASYSLAGEAATSAQETAVVSLLRDVGEVPVGERLAPARLIQLQGALFRGGADHAAYGLRREERFLGSAGSMGFQRVEYPCPPPRALESLLHGLAISTQRLSGAPPAVQAAVASFGFGFIHPLLEGNGRVHRFLVHAALAQGRAVKNGQVLPVSEVMLTELALYQEALRAYSGAVRASAEGLAGVPFLLEPGQPFSFPGYERVAPLYRYPVLTGQTVYLERTLHAAIDTGLTGEAHRLQALAPERAQLAEKLGLPLARVDLLMRLVRQQGAALAATQARASFPGISDATLREVEALVSPGSRTRSRRKPRDDPRRDPKGR